MKLDPIRFALGLFACPLAIVAKPGADTVEELAEHFFRPNNAFMTNVCPKGRYLLYLGYAESDDKRRLYSLDLRTLDATKQDIRFRYDIRPDMNLSTYSIVDEETVFYASTRANRYTISHFVSPTDLSGGNEISWDGLGGASLLDPLLHERGFALFTLRRSGHMLKADPHPDVIKVDLGDGSFQKIIPNPGNIESWITDDSGQIRIGSYDAGDATGYIYRASNLDDWQPLDLRQVFPEEDREGASISPMDFMADGKTLICRVTNEDGYAGLQLVNIETMELASKAIFRPPYSLDDGHLIKHHGNGAIIGYNYDAERLEALYFDPGYRKLQASVDAAMPDLTNMILGFSEQGEHAIIASFSDVQPGLLSALSMKEGKIRPIQVRRPWIDREKLSPMKPVTFAARDGETIHGYLTSPVKGSYREGEPYPLITIVHGGPAARVGWRYSSEVQFFAALGFGVLQVNFRGSTGYGANYQGDSVVFAMEKGVTDVADGVRWAIGKGYADSNNIFIYGASFGGYSTAMSLVEEPDLYTAGVATMGVYDWEMIGEEDLSRNYTWADELHKDLEGKREDYIRWSPSNHADKIKRPLMILHGGLDRRVNIKQPREFAAALDKAGVEYEYHATHWMEHGFMGIGSPQELTYYKRIASFFLKYLN